MAYSSSYCWQQYQNAKKRLADLEAKLEEKKKDRQEITGVQERANSLAETISRLMGDFTGLLLKPVSTRGGEVVPMIFSNVANNIRVQENNMCSSVTNMIQKIAAQLEEILEEIRRTKQEIEEAENNKRYWYNQYQQAVKREREEAAAQLAGQTGD